MLEKRKITNDELIELLEKEYDKILNMSDTEAEHEALKNLEGAGLLDKNGNMKQNIVTGDFF